MKITRADLRRAGIAIQADMNVAVKRKPALRADRFRSELERAYADRLALLYRAGEIRWWKYEPLKLRLADGCWFTPDFAIITAADELELHECKGFMREAARVRLHIAAESFPFVARFVLVRRVDGEWQFTEIGHQHGEHD